MGSRRSQVCFANIFYENYLYIKHRPKNKEELFNLRHASARNVIERIFGVLKRRFRILLLAPEYSLEIQARIPAALCAIHNFIRTHDSADEATFAGNDNGDGNAPFDDYAAPGPAAVDEPSERRDHIAQSMWDTYLAVRMERGINDDNDDQSESEPEEDG